MTTAPVDVHVCRQPDLRPLLESPLAPHWSGPALSWPSVEEVTAVLKVMSDLEAEVDASEQHVNELDPTMLGATD